MVAVPATDLVVFLATYVNGDRAWCDDEVVCVLVHCMCAGTVTLLRFRGIIIIVDTGREDLICRHAIVVGGVVAGIHFSGGLS